MDLGFLAGAYRHEGSYASVYLENRRIGEDAAQQVELRWQSLAQQLRRDGADAATLDVLERALVPRRRPGAVGAQGRGVVAGGGRLLLDRPLGEPSAGVAGLSADQARWAPLPHLLPLLGYAEQPVPYLLVLADRIGADLHVVADGQRRVARVEGEDHPLHKVRAGGWSHRRFQQRAENLWEHNAGLVSTRATKLARRHRVALVVLAGDVRARTAIAERLPAGVRGLTVETEHGGRAAGAAEAPLWRDAADLAAERTRQEHRRVVLRFLADRGDAHRTAEGLEQVIAAVRQSAVETLLLDPVRYLDPAAQHRDVWVGPAGADLALTRSELERLGVEEYAADRPDSALLRGCMATGAALELVRGSDPDLADGVAALLRYPLAS